MSGRNPFLPITAADLKAISREAASDYLSEGTDPTDAVVKAASLFGRDLTNEHVRRVCEMTYHDIFERQFRVTQMYGQVPRGTSHNIPPSGTQT